MLPAYAGGLVRRSRPSGTVASGLSGGPGPASAVECLWKRSAALMERRRYLLDHLSRHATLDELRRSGFFAECSSEIESLLGSPELSVCEKAVPRISTFVRVAQWNLEKGKQFDAIVRLFETDDALKWADIVLLNEADCGMSRSGNRHVARCLGEILGMNVAFAPACLELTRGVDEEQVLPGENRESLQGNAVLSRHPMLAAQVVRLPQCFEPYEFHEKRYGGRNCLWVRLRVGAGTLWVGSTHLEVRNTPVCRATQMKKLVTAAPGNPGEAHLLGGDLNTHCLRRGTRARALWAAAQLLLGDARKVKSRFLTPQLVEPLFGVAARAGFSLSGLNPAEATASTMIEGSEDARMVPAVLRNFLRRRLEPYRDGLPMKLDWFLGRDVHPLRAGEITDRSSGVSSCDPSCALTLRTGPARLSDHSPIYTDIKIP